MTINVLYVMALITSTILVSWMGVKLDRHPARGLVYSLPVPISLSSMTHC